MKIRFWGVRGSIPVPGKDTAETGGNTSCVEMVSSNGDSVVLDAGTGLRVFGLDYIQRKNASKEIHLFISHAHWDHIQGFPFFIPALKKEFTLHIYGEDGIEEALRNQMKAPYFPLDWSFLPSNVVFHTLDDKPVEIPGFRITPFAVVHPQEALGFLVESNGGTKAAYSTDTENFVSNGISIIDHVRGIDALLYDAQYTPEEYETRKGFGHSTYTSAIEVAKKAGIKKLVLFHHEPTHNDADILKIEKMAQELFPNSIAAREGQTLEV